MKPHSDLETLKDRHKVLEADLAEALSHPSSCDEEIVAIKRLKLKLKDEIAALEAKLPSSA